MPYDPYEIRSLSHFERIGKSLSRLTEIMGSLSSVMSTLGTSSRHSAEVLSVLFEMTKSIGSDVIQQLVAIGQNVRTGNIRLREISNHWREFAGQSIKLGPDGTWAIPKTDADDFKIPQLDFLKEPEKKEEKPKKKESDYVAFLDGFRKIGKSIKGAFGGIGKSFKGTGGYFKETHQYRTQKLKSSLGANVPDPEKPMGMPKALKGLKKMGKGLKSAGTAMKMMGKASIHMWVIQGLMQAIEPLLMILQPFELIFSAIGILMTAMVMPILEQLYPLLTPLFESIVSMVPIFTIIGQVIGFIIGILVKLAPFIWIIVKVIGVLTGAISPVIAIIIAVVAIIIALVSGFKNFFKGLDEGKSVIEALGDGIKAFFQTIWNMLQWLWGKLTFWTDEDNFEGSIMV